MTPRRNVDVVREHRVDARDRPPRRVVRARLAVHGRLARRARRGIGDVDRQRARVDQRVGPALGARGVGVEADGDEGHQPRFASFSSR
jgi:hypothetical protein